MELEQTFRILMVAGILLVLPFGLYYRVRAHAQGDQIDRSEEGRWLLLTLRPLGLIGMAAFVVRVIRPDWMVWSSMPLPFAVRCIGVVLGAGAAALFISALRHLGTNITDTVVTRARHTLVTTGPYQWVRHPFYVASACAVFATTLVAANWFLGGVGLLILLLIVIRTPIEERKLIEKFGERYTEYADRTGRYWPRRRPRTH